jgi:hypothetical protein
MVARRLAGRDVHAEGNRVMTDHRRAVDHAPLFDPAFRIQLSGDDSLVHGPAAVVAGMASQRWAMCTFVSELTTLVAALDGAIDLIPDKHVARVASDCIGQVAFAMIDAARMGARLGYAAGRTVGSADLGWEKWAQVAGQALVESGCDLDGHMLRRQHGVADYAAELTTASRQSLANAAAGPVIEQPRQPHR